ncbi:MAG: hypothetical protein Q9159_006324 [Coniocarpon cinnabarinum]
MTEPFTFAHSRDLELPVSVRINHLDGHQDPIPLSTLLKRPDLRHVPSNSNPVSDLYVTAQLWANSKSYGPPIQTAYKAFKNRREWNEWLYTSVNYSQAPASSQLAITMWDICPTGGKDAVGHAAPFGGTTIPIFDDEGVLRQGRQRCYVHRRKAADGFAEPATPYMAKHDRRTEKSTKSDDFIEDEELKELERLEGLLKKLENGEIQEDHMLDSKVFRYIEQLQRKLSKKMNEQSRHAYSNGTAGLNGDKQESKSQGPIDDAATTDVDINPGQFFLYIDFPRFDHAVVFTDFEYPPPPISTMQPQHTAAGDVQLKPPPEVTLGPGINETDPEAGRLIRIYDPEVGFKENPVESKHRRLFRNQRSGLVDRDAKPNAKTRDDLANVISAGPTEELSQAEKDLIWRFRHHLMRNKRALTKFVKSTNWNDMNEARQAVQLLPRWTEIDVDDALELLGPTVSNPAVRAYAVDRLRKADDEELLVYLLQLVQALKFEQVEAENPEDTAQDSSLARFLISRAVGNLKLGNFLHWYLMVEVDDKSDGQSTDNRKLFAKVEYDFMSELENTPHGSERRKLLLRQGELITVLSKISKDIRFSKGDRLQKIDRLKKLLNDPANDLLKYDPPLPLPLDPDVSVTSCVPEEAIVFKSSLLPLLIPFKTNDNKRYSIIFKTGDDLRQDQLVIQIIMLMDRLLRNENLDLKLSPYRILATSTSAGAVQFLPSMTLANIVSRYKGSLLAYLREHNPDKKSELGVRKEAMDTFVKSCAGYCVITYLLGVGDRHLDNLLLMPNGNFFHADFGYILGRDPKPFAPLMKLSKEMIEGMGGPRSDYYAQFKQHCFTAYTTLRKSSSLILNLFSLMVDANIPDIRMEPDKAVEKVKERFHLELRTEEEVVRSFEALMEDSVSAMAPAVIDWAHGFVQRFRA